jgi:hypothetical protein
MRLKETALHEQAIPPRPEQISTRLWRVGGESWNGTVNAVSAEGDANVYLLRGVGAYALIDCATNAGRPQIETNLRDVAVQRVSRPRRPSTRRLGSSRPALPI